MDDATTEVPDAPHSNVPSGNCSPAVEPLPVDRWDARLHGLLATAPRNPGGGVPHITGRQVLVDGGLSAV
ncbi:hypothetical protein [Streptomyces sp. NPDC007905]|uniref:hypothetical protein n=1 Tax=Streptomyces sp. NPDC007905 TaxID=3364788 RepID=UPI0036EB8A03